MAEGQPTNPIPKSQRRYASRKARGLCVRCGRSQAPGKAQCGACIEAQARKRVATRQTGLEHGRCTCCGSERDRAGRKLCSGCNAYRADERARRTTEGLCPCSRPINTPGRRKCDACNELERRRKQAFRAAGLCQCGKARPVEGRKRCRACLDYFQWFSAGRVRAWRSKGLCIGCGRTAPRPGKIVCKACSVAQVVRCRKWLRTHPDHASAIWAAGRFRRQQRIAFNGGNFTAKEWRALKAFHGHRCLACGRAEPEVKLTVDHVKPISKGGTNDIGNIQPLCLTCNLEKHAREIDYRGLNTI